MDSHDFPEVVKHCKSFTLIMPAISVSNAGQLAVDLLVQSTGAEKMGNIWHEAFIPLVGAHPYIEGSNDLCTEFEVYQLKEKKMLIIQFRSPVWQNKEENFLELLVDWFCELGVAKVVILSSLYAYERSDRQIAESHVHCCVCPLTQSLYLSTFRPLNCRYVGVGPGQDHEDTDVGSSAVMSKETFLPGAGFTQSFHLKCIDKNIPCVSFFKFCSDGDNTPEALELAQVTDGWLNIVPDTNGKTFRQPPSWKYIFGGPSPPELFP